MEAERMEPAALTDLASDVSRKAANLVAAHVDLLQVEVREMVYTTARSVSLWMTGYAVMSTGTIFILVATAFWLQDAYQLQPFQAWGCVGLSLVLLSIPCLIVAYYQIREVDLVPMRTLRSFQESLTWRR